MANSEDVEDRRLLQSRRGNALGLEELVETPFQHRLPIFHLHQDRIRTTSS